MLIPLVLLFGILLFSTRFSRQTLFKSYNSVSQTQAIKGFFVITIFFSHFCSYVQLDAWYDDVMRKYCRHLGQLMVAPFFFYSGYGIFESVKKKGAAYIKTFPKRRILKTLLHFDFAVLLFFLLDFFMGESISWSAFLLSLVAWESIGNSNWFVFAILCAYVFAYVGLWVFKGEMKRALLFITMMSFLFIFFVRQFKAEYWVNTILALPLGCSLSLFKEKFEKIVHRHFVELVGLVALLFGVAKCNIICSSFVNSQLILFSFSAAIVLISLHVQVNSKILSWFGTLVFEIYILQRIPMNLLFYMQLNNQNIYLFFVISFVCTLALSILFKKWNVFFDSKILCGLKG